MNEENLSEEELMDKIEKLALGLQNKFPKISGIKPGYEWSGKSIFKDQSIHLGDAGEGGEIDDEYAASYYAEDYKEEVYVLGVNKKLIEALNEIGYFPEWYDSGTLIAYKY